MHKPKTVKKEFYLKFRCNDPNKYHPELCTPSASANKPSCTSNEIAIKMSLDIPLSLFKETVLEVNGVIPDRETKKVEMEIAEAAQVLLGNSLGLKVNMLNEVSEN